MVVGSLLGAGVANVPEAVHQLRPPAALPASPAADVATNALFFLLGAGCFRAVAPGRALAWILPGLPLATRAREDAVYAVHSRRAAGAGLSLDAEVDALVGRMARRMWALAPQRRAWGGEPTVVVEQLEQQLWLARAAGAQAGFVGRHLPPAEREASWGLLRVLEPSLPPAPASGRDVAAALGRALWLAQIRARRERGPTVTVSVLGWELCTLCFG